MIWIHFVPLTRLVCPGWPRHVWLLRLAKLESVAQVMRSPVIPTAQSMYLASNSGGSTLLGIRVATWDGGRSVSLCRYLS